MVRRLSQLRGMKREVEELSQRIGRMELETRGRVTAPGLDRARTLMEARRWACMEELGRLYAFIDDIPDSRLRRIFAFRYIDGLSWLQVAFKIGEHDEQYPRRLHNRYVREVTAGENSCRGRGFSPD